MHTTLNKIRKHHPCSDGWEKLLRHLGKTKADDEPLSIESIYESNGFDDALWCLRAVDGHEREIRLYAVWCARRVEHLMTDERSKRALDTAERYANGMASREELNAAYAAADAAYTDANATADAAAADAARAAAYAARSAAADVAAADATAYAAADATAYAARAVDAAHAVDAAAAYAEERKAQEKEFRKMIS